MSINNLFSAKKTCMIYFYELNPPTFGSFGISDTILGIPYELKNSDFVAKKNCICEFLKEKFIEEYNDYSGRLLKFYYVNNRFESIMGDGSCGTAYLVGEINDEKSSEVAKIIDKSFNDGTDVNVYFYPHDLPNKSSKASKKDKTDKADKNDKSSKAKTGSAYKKTKDVGKGPVIDHDNGNKDNQKKNPVNNNVKKKNCRCCNKS